MDEFAAGHNESQRIQTQIYPLPVTLTYKPFEIKSLHLQADWLGWELNIWLSNTTKLFDES